MTYRQEHSNDCLSPKRVDLNKRHDFSSARKKNESIKHLYLDKENENTKSNKKDKYIKKASPKKTSLNQIENMFANSENKIMNQIRIEAKQKMDEERIVRNINNTQSSDLRNEFDRIKKENNNLRKSNYILSDKVKNLEISLAKSSNINAVSGQSNVNKAKEMTLNKKVLNLNYKISHLKFKEQI